MAEETIRTRLTCPGMDYITKCLFNETYNLKLYQEVLKFPGVKVLELQNTGDQWKRRLQIDPPLTGLPGPVVKIIGDKFSYIEEGTFDSKTKRYTFKVTPSSAGDKTKTAGESWFEDDASGCTLITRLAVDVKIFMVGGMVEEKILKDFRSSLEQSAPFINQFTKQA